MMYEYFIQIIDFGKFNLENVSSSILKVAVI